MIYTCLRFEEARVSRGVHAGVLVHATVVTTIDVAASQHAPRTEVTLPACAPLNL